MNKFIKYLFLLNIFCCVAFAEPFGCLIGSIEISPSNHQVIITDVQTGISRTIARTEELWTRFSGVAAAPFLGNPCVIQNGDDNTIRLLSFDNSMHIIVSSTGAGMPAEPASSIDGSKIVYIKQDAAAGLKDEVHIVNSDGSGDTLVYTSLEDVVLFRPAFSPDGKTIALSYYDDHDGSYSIILLSLTDGTIQFLINLAGGSPMLPAYSPDGKKLVYVALDSSGFNQVYIANADGSSSHKITSLSSSASYPVFSPDGKYVAFKYQKSFSIIDLSNNEIITEYFRGFKNCYGLVWCCGAQKSEGEISKVKIKEKAVSIKIDNFLNGTYSTPTYGLVKVDNVLFTLNNADYWINKKNKKYIYKDKANKITSKITVKNGKAKFSAKKLNLSENTDYTLNTNINVIVNFGDYTLMETIELDEKGKYKK